MDRARVIGRIREEGKAGKQAALRGDLFGAGISVGVIRTLQSAHPRCRLIANEAVETIRWYVKNAWLVELGIPPSRNEALRTRVHKPFTDSELWPHGQESRASSSEHPARRGGRRRRGHAAP